MSVAAGADPYDRDLGFPICDHPDKFYGKPKGGLRPNKPLKSTGCYKIRHLDQAAQAFIRGFSRTMESTNRGSSPTSSISTTGTSTFRSCPWLSNLWHC